ncbi:uncharacterized protein LOC109794201 [Cajanus cajan]|nr:uncharacterized protein LOC109794201 [Cajanus cajan]
MVYASPHIQGRVQLWRDLCMIATQVDGPWNLMGDFNVVLHSYERQGSSPSSSIRGDNAFRKFANHCSLIDIGYQGAPFNWHRGLLYEHLDRSLVSYDWHISFPDASLIHLNPFKSDHSPILLHFGLDENLRRRKRPFGFEAAWLTHEAFQGLMQ